MPIHHLRRLTGSERTESANRELATVLAFVAGATNAGGYLAVHQYTSHMSGIVSALADNTALGLGRAAFGGLEAVVSFLFGAATTAIMVNWARRRHLHGLYAMPLMVEAGLLLVFGATGHAWEEHTAIAVPSTVILLCYTMGLQNAVITKLSGAVIRTTHVTGMVTDVGIELGKLLYISRKPGAPPVQADLGRLRLLVLLICMFFSGGVTGALGFKHLGFVFTLPLSLLLLLLAAVPIVDDLRKIRA